MSAPSTPEQRFRRWVYSSLALGALMFVYFVLADLHIPVSPEARLTQVVTQVAPEVSGRVVALHVHNNQKVARGDVLFTIDPRDYTQAIDVARLQIEEAQRDNHEIDASIAVAQAELGAARSQAAIAAREAGRFQSLATSQYVSRQSADERVSASEVAAAQVRATQQQLQRLIVTRGTTNAENLRARQALTQLESAQLGLARTSVRAGTDGIISNLQLEQGTYATAGVPRLALVTSTPSLYADFREKTLRHVGAGTQAAVVFDAFPGQVFKAEVVSVDAGIRSGQQAADGQLAATEQTDRWVREAERARVNLRLLDQPEGVLISGARATVQLYPRQHGWVDWLADAQIRLISWFHYVY